MAVYGVMSLAKSEMSPKGDMSPKLKTDMSPKLKTWGHVDFNYVFYEFFYFFYFFNFQYFQFFRDMRENAPSQCGAKAERTTRGREVPGSKLARAIWFFL